VAAAVVHRRTGPGGGEDLQCLVQHLASQPIIKLLAGLGQLAAEAVAAETDTEGEAATAEPVQGRGFPGDLGWPAAGEGRDHGTEPQVFGGGGDRGQRDPRVGHLPDRGPPAQVVPHEDPVPAGLLGLGGQTRDHRRVGKTVEDRQPERRAQSGRVGALTRWRAALLWCHVGS
jgi:hypothetical protein